MADVEQSVCILTNADVLFENFQLKQSSMLLVKIIIRAALANMSTALMKPSASRCWLKRLFK